jgi:hypothetical protein
MVLSLSRTFLFQSSFFPLCVFPSLTPTHPHTHTHTHPPPSRVVRLDGYTRCPEALGAAVESAARSLRGGLVGAGTRRRPPPPGSHLSAGLLELEVALPALHGVPPALDAFVAAICEGGRGLFGGESEAGFETSAHVVERISKSWFLGGRD